MRMLFRVCGVLVLVLCTGTILLVARAQQNSAALAILALDRNLMPGRPMNNDYCTESEFDVRFRYCHDLRLSITVIEGVIRQVTIDTHDSSLNIGQVLAEWGTPLAADYTRYGTVAVYWADRYVYVTPDQHFNPNTPVKSVTYSGYQFSPQLHNSWRGFMSVRSSR